MSERTYYNTNYNILYQNIKDIEKSDTQYRKDYLTVFGLNEYNYEEIDKGITSLHTKIKDNTSFKNIFEAAKKHKHLMWLLQGGNASILWVLFNYDHFYYVFFIFSVPTHLHYTYIFYFYFYEMIPSMVSVKDFPDLRGQMALWTFLC